MDEKELNMLLSKNLFICLFVYPTNIYEAFIKLFLYTKHCAIWYKFVFYGNKVFRISTLILKK